MKKKLLVSACLLGECCRYDGKSKEYDRVLRLKDKYELVPVCPEVMGGLPVPRPGSEICFGRVVNTKGEDVTENFLKGANEALRIARENRITLALLKERSPSCGKGKIYDGSFSGKLIDGNGVTAGLLSDFGIKIFGESEIDLLLKNS